MSTHVKNRPSFEDWKSRISFCTIPRSSLAAYWSIHNVTNLKIYIYGEIWLMNSYVYIALLKYLCVCGGVCYFCFSFRCTSQCAQAKTVNSLTKS